jgi:serine/threonine-protein kinase
MRLLGEGGMGMVFEVEHAVTGRRLALKVMRDLEHEVVHRFIREARAACAVKHPAILPVHDVFDIEQGGIVIVMDLLRGESLDVTLERQSKLRVTDAVSILLPIVSALGAAHELGIIHRDVKPGNVFVSQDGSPYLLDFGIAKDTYARGAVLTDTKAAIGTPAYMSPEQAFGDPVDHRADIWSMGLTLYEALSGDLPTLADAPGKMYDKIAKASFAPLHEIAPEVPEPLSKIVKWMLAPDRERRAPSMRAVFDALKPYADPKRVARYEPPPLPNGVDSPTEIRSVAAMTALSSASPNDTMPSASFALQDDTTTAAPTLPKATPAPEVSTGMSSTTTSRRARVRTGRAGLGLAVVALGAAAVAGVGYFAFGRGGRGDERAASVETTTAPTPDSAPALAAGTPPTLEPIPSASAEPPPPVSATASASAAPSSVKVPHVPKPQASAKVAAPKPSSSGGRGGLF